MKIVDAANLDDRRSKRTGPQLDLGTTSRLNQNTLEETRRLWQPKYRGKLSERETVEISSNLCLFFTILAEWEEARVALEQRGENQRGREDAGA